MALSEWIMAALMAVIIITGLSLYFYFRQKFKKSDDFEGIVTERGRNVRRANIELEKELNDLEKELAENQ